MSGWKSELKKKARKTWTDVYNKDLFRTNLPIPGTVLGLLGNKDEEDSGSAHEELAICR